MAIVETWFPVAIYTEQELISVDALESLTAYCLDKNFVEPTGWVGGTLSTHRTHDLLQDSRFNELLNVICQHVNNFAFLHGSKATYEMTNAWLNINTKNTFQEFHTHNGSIFSCAFYLSAPSGSGALVFEDPKPPDMLPLRNIEGDNQLNFIRATYPATTNTLLIFRSYLRHMVQPGTNEEPRISISANFI